MPGFSVTEALTSGSSKRISNQSYKQMMNTDLSEEIDSLFKIMSAKAKAMIPGDKNETDFSSDVLQIKSMMQQFKTNESMDDLNKVNKASYSLGLVNLEGQIVEHAGDTISFNGTPQEISLVLPKNIESAKILILSEAGEVLKTSNLSTKEGRQTFKWDGKNEFDEQVEKGIYRVRVEAIDNRQRMRNIETYVEAKITGTEFDSKGMPSLRSNNSSITDFYAIRKPSASPKPFYRVNSPSVDESL